MLLNVIDKPAFKYFVTKKTYNDENLIHFSALILGIYVTKLIERVKCELKNEKTTYTFITLFALAY